MMTASTPPCVSITIPVYNSASTLERCIRSAMRQTLADIEILIADDGSTDDSATVAEQLAHEDPRIRVLRIVPNGGKPAAMNRLIAEARGEWVAVLDADDAYHDERLERLVSAATTHGTDMAADNIVYVDGGADQIVRLAFEASQPTRIVAKADLLSNSDSYGDFDFGILKPVIRRRFLLEHQLTYYEKTRLSEDFYYLMNFFLAGGRGVLTSEPYYYWTMPFGAISRTWTTTGSGTWRYDYRPALAANEHFIKTLREAGEMQVVAMLEARSRQYRVMIHYLDAQRAAAEGGWLRSLMIIVGHPSTYGLLFNRIVGRVARRLRPEQVPQPPTGMTHPSMRLSAASHVPAGSRGSMA
jgi:succinoglycan biosynthesis protein ExoO